MDVKKLSGDKLENKNCSDSQKSGKVNWTFVGILVAIIIGVASIYFPVFYEGKTIVNIELKDKILLTKPIEVSNLTVKYTYKDSIEVENLWMTTFVLRNVGTKTIYGKGFDEKTIRGNYIPIIVDSCEKLLSINITNENAGVFMDTPKQLIVQQWRPDEFIEITILSDGENAPTLNLSDRDIKDGRITYSTFSLVENNNKGKFIDKIGSKYAKFIKFLYIFIVFILIVLFLVIITAHSTEETKENKDLRKWGLIRFFIVIIITLIPLLLIL